MSRILYLLRLWLSLLLLFALGKMVFLMYNADVSPFGCADAWQVWWHGLTMDISTAGYVTALPLLLALISVWWRNLPLRWVLWPYLTVVAVLLAVIIGGDTVLYEFWKFKLNAAIFGYMQNPEGATSSVSPLFIITRVGGILLLAVLAGWLLLRRTPVHFPAVRRRLVHTVLLVLCGGALFVGIRGGVQQGVMNVGVAYYSPSLFLNHAAVNPAFSLLSSLNKTKDFGGQFNWQDDKSLARSFEGLYPGETEDIQDTLLRVKRPNVLVVLMESFGSKFVHELGGLPDVAPGMSRLIPQSIFWTQFYSNSFRTDRGLVSILSGYPAQPTHSIMKYPAKSAHLPSLARSLAEAKHYTSTYFYGGDVDFANQRSWLVSQGYQHIISDADFPIKDKLSKWGVPDHIVAQRLLADIKSPSSKAPHLRVFQTSSSHEPFDVPYKRLADKRLNAFAYTDSVIGNLMRQYAQLPSWRNTLVVLVPDHVGAYTEHLDNFTRKRYEIPLIITGGAIARPMKIDAIGSQHDIAATLLGQLGIKHNDFTFSKNLMSKSTPKFAFFTVPNAFGIVTDSAAVIFDNKMKQAVFTQGGDTKQCTECGKAYLQKLYDNLDKL